MSKFVSAGTVDQLIERSDEWLRAQKAIDTKIVEKQKLAQQQDGKSLYETLQANKAAKQEAFEEANRLKNQFRSLDHDEVEFLESVNEAARAKENAVKKDTAEQLNHFRDQRLQAEREAKQRGQVVEPPVVTEDWIVTSKKKRKREKASHTVPGVKVRRQSSSHEIISSDVAPEKVAKPQDRARESVDSEAVLSDASDSVMRSDTVKSSGNARELGLAAYSSDED